MSRWLLELLDILENEGVEAYDKRLDEMIEEHDKMNGIVRIGKLSIDKFPEFPPMQTDHIK